MTSAYIISACRSPVTPRGGALVHLSLPDLAAPILTAALTRAGIAPRQVDEVICSTALGPGGNPARSIALAAGLPEHVAGLSIDRQCAGGLDALALARQMILSGAADIVVAGGAGDQAAGAVGIGVFGGEAAGLPGELEIVDCIARGARGAVFPALVGAHESQARTGLVCAIESRSVRHSRTL